MGIVRFYTPWRIIGRGFERKYRKTGSAMADMLARSLFLLYSHMFRLVVDGFIVKRTPVSVRSCIKIGVQI